MISQENKKGIKNPWVLSIVALIVIVLAVNATFIWYATHNKSTLVERDYKTKDRKGNEEVLTELRQQQALGWQVSLNKPKSLVINTPIAYEIRVTDKEGRPVSGVMQVEAYRAADATKDFSTPFSETAPGSYQGSVTFPLKGYWELHIVIVRDKERFQVDTGRIKIAEAA